MGVAIWFLLRGGVSLFQVSQLIQRFSRHHYLLPVIVDSLVWFVLGVGLLFRSRVATFWAIGWTCLQIPWATYGFVVTSSWRFTPRVVEYMVGAAINVAIVIILVRYQKRHLVPDTA